MIPRISTTRSRGSSRRAANQSVSTRSESQRARITLSLARKGVDACRARAEHSEGFVSGSPSGEETSMRTGITRALLLGGVLLAASACATSEEWGEWGKHPAHFASGGHAMFSFRNTEGSAPRVTRSEIDRARAEQWWGKVITVSAEQIIQQ